MFIRNAPCLALLAAFLPAALHADAVINLCTADNEPVAGVDLSRAIAAGGRVTFSCPAGSVIIITAPHAISRNTQIDGSGSVTLDARGATAMFSLGAGSLSLTLNGLTMRGGIPKAGVPGGVASGQGTLVVNNSTITGNTAPINLSGGEAVITATNFVNDVGPAIQAPSISLTNSKIQGVSGNPMVSSGGRVTIDHSVVSGGGGSVFDRCTLSIAGSQFMASSSSAVTSGCDTYISTSKFLNNHGANGGGLYVTKGASGLSISGSTFSGNVASAQGGAIAFEPSTVTPRSLQLSAVTFEGNAAQDGGAINLGSFLENNNKLEGRALSFSSNTASKSGGAIAGTNAQLVLARVLFVNNTAGRSGGAIESLVYGIRPSIIANSIFSGNGAPGGSALHGSSIQFINVTIANNLGGPALSSFWPSPVLANPETYRLITLHNVAFSKNAGGGCDTGPAKALFLDAGQNLQFPAAGCAASIPVADPAFDAMFAPAWHGPASGSGDLAACMASPVGGVDLFGRHRPQGRNCAIGAVEGDLQSAVQQNNPRLGDVPKPPPSSCPCTSGSGGGAASQPPPSTVTSLPQATPPSSAPGNSTQPPDTSPTPAPSTSPLQPQFEKVTRLP